MGQVCSGDRKAGVDKLDPLTHGRKTLDGQRTIVEYDSPFQSPSPTLPSSPETEKMTNSDEEFIMELNRQHMDQYRRRKSVTKLVIEEAVNNAEKVAASILRRESIQNSSGADRQEETNSRNVITGKDGRTDQQEETNGNKIGLMTLKCRHPDSKKFGIRKYFFSSQRRNDRHGNIYFHPTRARARLPQPYWKMPPQEF